MLCFVLLLYKYGIDGCDGRCRVRLFSTFYREFLRKITSFQKNGCGGSTRTDDLGPGDAAGWEKKRPLAVVGWFGIGHDRTEPQGDLCVINLGLLLV